MNSILPRLLASALAAKIKQKISYPPVPASDGEGTHLFLQALTANTWRLFFLLCFSVIGCILIDLYLYFNDTYLYAYEKFQRPTIIFHFYEKSEDYIGITVLYVLFMHITAFGIYIPGLTFVYFLLPYLVSVFVYRIMIGLLYKKYSSNSFLREKIMRNIRGFYWRSFLYAIIWAVITFILSGLYTGYTGFWGLVFFTVMRVPLGMLTAAGILLRKARRAIDKEDVVTYKKIFMSLAMIYWLVPAVILFLFSLYRLAV